MDVETRLRALEHRNQILELSACYALCVASGDINAMMKLFADGGVFGRPGRTLSGDALRELLAANITPGDRVPLVMNHIIQLEDDQASGTCAMYTPWSPHGPLCGHYRDCYVLEREQWRFRERLWYPYASPEKP